MYTCRTCHNQYGIDGFHTSSHKRLENGSTKVDCKMCANVKTRELKRIGRARGAQWTQDYAERVRVATPKWLTEEDHNRIREIYASRGKDDSVDHIIPLKGKKVCGLHVPENLEVIPLIDNIKKSNRY